MKPASSFAAEIFAKGPSMVNRAIIVTLAATLSASLNSSAYALDGKFHGLNRRLVSLLYQIERHYGRSVTVVSGCRSFRHNRQIGGARESFHLHCMAADIHVRGVGKGALARYASSLPGRGGVGIYCHDGNVHIDVGPRRNWVWSCNGKRHYTGSPARHRRTHIAAG